MREMDVETNIVIDTSPLLAICAACGHFEVLKCCYNQVLVPYEVGIEIMRGGKMNFARHEFMTDTWLDKATVPTQLNYFLSNTIDSGEASVIQLALDCNIKRVAIDDRSGRRVARICGLLVTGSLGILIKAKAKGYPIQIRNAISRMCERGIWLSEDVTIEALRLADE